MMDYLSWDELSYDDVLGHLTLFVDCDPITFVDAIKYTKWENPWI